MDMEEGSMSINKVIISGHLYFEPELKKTPGGLQVLSLGVAVNDPRMNQETKQWETYTNFISCTMFGTRAKKMQPLLAKGSKVAIEGKLHWSQWADKMGLNHTKVTVNVDTIELMSKKTPDQEAVPKPIPPNAEEWLHPERA